MRLTITRRLALVALLPLAGCGMHARPAASAQVAPTAPQYPVITRLVSRGQTVVVSAGPRSPLYSVQSPQGTLLVSNVTLEQLRDDHPDYFRWIQPMVANDTAVVADVAAR